MGIIITDGTTYYSPNQSYAPTVNGVRQAVNNPRALDEVSSGSPNTLITFEASGGGSNTYDHICFDLPHNILNGDTSWDVELYIYASQTTANTATLSANYTLRLAILKALQTIGSVSQT